jgi:general secretion pathway protein A
MQLVLTGQPELSDKLNLPELEQFAQRIGVEYHLRALSYPETQKYIEHRMEVAGADHKIFTNEACAAIFCYSEGVPRRINNLCDFALVYAFADDSKEVNVNTVIDMIKDKRSSTIIKMKESQNPDVKRVRSWLLELYNIHLV